MVSAFVSVASAVPWGTVIEKLPAIIDGATRLFAATGITRAKIPDSVVLDAKSNRIDSAKLQEAVNALEASLLSLNNQMSEAADLIKALAETNKSLVRAGQLHRRLLLLTSTMALLALGVAAYSLRS